MNAAATLAGRVIVAEPSAGTIGTHGKGQVRVDVTLTGRAAHSSRPEAGHNAIQDAAAFVTWVERANLESAVEGTLGVGPRTYGVGIINGGANASTLPAECTVTVDRRVLPTEPTIHRRDGGRGSRRPGSRRTVLGSTRPPAARLPITRQHAGPRSRE